MRRGGGGVVKKVIVPDCITYRLLLTNQLQIGYSRVSSRSSRNVRVRKVRERGWEVGGGGLQQVASVSVAASSTSSN